MRRRRFISALTLTTGALALRPATPLTRGAAWADAGLSYTERRVGDVSVFDLKGRLTSGEGSLRLRRLVADALRAGRRKLLFNLAGVTEIDSSGIGELVSTYTSVHREGGSLKLLKPTKKVKDLLTITKLLTVFDVYDSESDALDSFKGAASATRKAEPRPPAAADDIENRVRRIVADELGVDEAEVKPAACFVKDLGADSLDTVELIMRFEEEFGIEITDGDAEKMVCVADALAYLRQKVGRPAK